MIETTPTLQLTDNRQLELLAFAYSASRIDGHAIGWLPRTAYVQAHDSGRMLACYNNEDLVGFVIFGHSLTETRVYQIWVRRDARMLVHGRSLIDRLNQVAWEHGSSAIGLWCADDLEANFFWPAIGFEYTNWRWGKAKRARRHHQWIRNTYDPRLALPVRSNNRSPSTASAN